MKNPLLKNNKTWLLGDIQHRTSHYNRILCARSRYGKLNEVPKTKQIILDHIHCKYRNITEQERVIQNKRLMESLVSIDKKNGRYGNDGYRQPKSMKNQYVKNQSKNKIFNDNIELYRKIMTISSSIGSKKLWKMRKKQLQNLGKLRDRQLGNFMKFDQQFYQSFRKIKNKKSIKSVLKVQSRINQLGNKLLKGDNGNGKDRISTVDAMRSSESL